MNLKHIKIDLGLLTESELRFTINLILKMKERYRVMSNNTSNGFLWKPLQDIIQQLEEQLKKYKNKEDK